MVESLQNSADSDDVGVLQGGSSVPIDPQAGLTDPDCLAVMYHYVRGADSTGRIEFRTAQCAVAGITDVEFSAQLDRLCETREPIDWPTLYAWSRGTGSIPKRSFLLTFDDGLADHARVVAPILEKRGMRGTFFVAGSVLETHRMLPAQALHVLLTRVEESEIEAEIRKLVGDGLADVPEDEARRMYHYESPVRARLKYLLTVMMPIEQRSAALADLFERYVGSSARWARQWYVGWDDLTRMQAAGHTIGAHGFSHEPLTRLSPEHCRDDLRKVQRLLADGLGPDIRPISYPYGAFNEDTMDACREVGLAHAFTTRRDVVRSSDDVFMLPRVDTIHVDAMLEEGSSCLKT